MGDKLSGGTTIGGYLALHKGNITPQDVNIIDTGSGVIISNEERSNLAAAFNNMIVSASGNGNSILTLNKQNGNNITLDLSHTHNYLSLSGGTITGTLTIGDNVNLYIGNGGDGRLYSDGSTSYFYTDLLEVYNELRINQSSSLTNVALTARGDEDTGINFPSSNTIQIVTGASERMRIDSNGNIGIGTSNPAAKLDVNGDLNISKDINVQGKINGFNISDFVTQNQLNDTSENLDNKINIVKEELLDEIKEPNFINLSLRDEVNHIEDAILEAPQEIISIEGKTYPVLTNEEDKELANLKINDEVYNELIVDGGIARLNQMCAKVTFDGSESWLYVSNWLTDNTVSFSTFVNYNKNFYNVKSSIFGTKNVSYASDEEGNIASGLKQNYAIKINKSRLNGYSDELSDSEKLNLFKQWLQDRYNEGNPLTVLYELAVKNPKNETISLHSKYTGDTNSDIYHFVVSNRNEISNENIILNNTVYGYGYSSTNTFWTKHSTIDNLISITVPKGILISEPYNLIYSTIQPRLAQTELKHVVNPRLESVGANLFDKNHNENHFGWLRDDDTKSSSEIYIISHFIKVKPNTNYTFNPSKGTNPSTVFYDKDKNYISGIKNSESKGNIMTPDNCYYIRVSLEVGDKDIYMLNEGLTPLPYEPYQSTQAIFYTTLREWDKIKVINGEYKKEVGSGEVTFDGSEEWHYYSGAQSTKTDVATFYRSVTNMGLYSNYSNLVSNYFPFYYNVWNYNRVGISSHATVSNIYINILKSELENYSDELSNEEKAILFKQWLSDRYAEGNPLTVAYELAETTLEDVDIIGVNDDDFHFEQGSTVYLSSDSNIIPTVNVKCAVDVAGQISFINNDLQEIKIKSQEYVTKEWVEDKNYLTSITSSMVTSALGYTPLSTTGKAADADKLDGISSGSFLRSDTNDTMNGKLIISSSGTLGGTDMSNYWLKIGDTLAFDPNEILIDDAGYIRTTGTNTLTLRGGNKNLELKTDGLFFDGNEIATQDWVNNQNYLTSLPNHTHYLDDIKFSSNNINFGNNTSGYGVVIGKDSNGLSGDYPIVIGQSSYGKADSIIIGNGIQAEGTSNIAIGPSVHTTDNGIAIGDNSKSIEYNTIAIGSSSEASEYGAIAIGDYSKVSGESSLVLGRHSESSDSYSISLGYSANTSASYTVAIGRGSSSYNSYEGVLGSSLTYSTKIWKVPGSFSVSGSKNFEIPHPKPEKSATHVIRHSAVEAPTAGDNLYRYRINSTKDNDIIYINLPDYFVWLNDNVQIFVTPQGHFGNGYGIYNKEQERLEIHCQTQGEYNVLVLGTRMDNHESIQTWNIKGVEREIGESWLGETYVFEVDEIIELEEIKEGL